VARDTRSQRRARREARDPSGVLAPAGPERTAPPGRPPKAPPVAQSGADGPGRESKAPGHVPGSGVIGFIRESVAELKKVEWPTQAQVVTGTTVVLIACIIVGVFLYANDELWKRIVENIVVK
jgi:preprotein translocase subunit SecE